MMVLSNYFSDVYFKEAKTSMPRTSGDTLPIITTVSFFDFFGITEGNWMEHSWKLVMDKTSLDFLSIS